MGWNNPPVSWGEFERKLSGGSKPSADRPGGPPGADGGDSPAWSRHRQEYEAPAIEVPDNPVPYAELHAHSSYSFLDGASDPEDLLEEATRLGLTALALTDHDGFYGIARMAEAASLQKVAPEHRVATIFGAELSLGLSGPQNGEPDPEGQHVLLLARGQAGYHRLAAAITDAHLTGAEKGRPVYDLERLAEQSAGDWTMLTGCRKGAVRQALTGVDGPWSRPDRTDAERAAGRELDRLIGLFGRDRVVVELFDHGDPLDSSCNDSLAALASARRLAVVATGNVHYASPEQHHLASALAAVRARRSLDDLDGWLPSSGAAHLRSGAEMAARFARYPGAIETTVDLAADLAFDLTMAKPRLPRQDVPEGHTPDSWLRELVYEGARELYPALPDGHRARIERELEVIATKGFAGYFLIVWDIVKFARSQGILCQGRGSAANSAVCYLLRVTAVDPIRYQLPFERFLSSIRDEEPDIDIDFDSDRREQVIQYVYEKYGRHNAAQVANVIQYRPKNAVRDMAKAFGASPGQQDAWSKQIERHDLGVDIADHDIPAPVVDLALEAMKLPRHLGIHSGGMVLTDRPVGEVCPIEHGRMDGRTVLQWDKDDCAYMGLVKFDLLGLGILSAIQHTFDIVREKLGEHWELATIPQEEAGVYDQLCRADSIGVFQVESRAQMGLLPRLQPRRLYDLVVQIAMVRPGPIQGGAVHPFVRRKLGLEDITYLHPKLVEPLERTMGVPVFQEQLMQIAVAVGGCSPEDADLLRRAMGSKRGLEKIGRLREKLYEGMAGNGITGADADAIYAKIEAFASFGFAESHAQSFGLLVYASAWLRLHYPGAFLAGLLRSQPMGFYSPATLTADARRHGVTVLRPDILRSQVATDLEAISGRPTGSATCLEHDQPPVPDFDRDIPFDSRAHARDLGFAVRLGLEQVTGIGRAVAQRIVIEREQNGDYRDMHDLVRRTGLVTAQLEALATADAFDCFGLSRRQALWLAGNAALDRAEFLPDSLVAVQPPLFTMPAAVDELVSDLWATGISPDDHPIRHVREDLDERRVVPSSALATTESGRRIEIAGVVTHRQRPSTASGITFMNLEDEHGLVNVICSVGVWKRYRRIARDSSALIVRGILERSDEGVANLLADRFERLAVAPKVRSRDFQ